MLTDFFITNFLLYLPDILPKILGESDIIRVRISGESDIIRVRISGESDTTYLSFSFSLN